MQSDLPKVLHTLKDKTLIEHVVQAVKGAGVTDKPIVIVNDKHTQIQDTLGARARYVVQKEQLGTAHAVMQAEGFLKGMVEQVVVLYGDMPFITSESVRRLVEEQSFSGAAMTLMTVMVPDFEGWRVQFSDFGRVIRDEKGAIQKIVERKDASKEELEVKECNTAYFCFDAAWLWVHLHSLSNDNAQREYYLTDLVHVAISEGARIHTIPVDPKEAIGINSKEHLASVEYL